MPCMSGSEVASAYLAWARAERPGKPTIPLAALTADADVEQADACKAAGMAIFLLKPLQSDGIASLREMALSHARDRRVACAAPGSTPQAMEAVESALQSVKATRKRGRNHAAEE